MQVQQSRVLPGLGGSHREGQQNKPQHISPMQKGLQDQGWTSFTAAPMAATVGQEGPLCYSSTSAPETRQGPARAHGRPVDPDQSAYLLQPSRPSHGTGAESSPRPLQHCTHPKHHGNLAYNCRNIHVNFGVLLPQSLWEHINLTTPRAGTSSCHPSPQSILKPGPQEQPSCRPFPCQAPPHPVLPLACSAPWRHRVSLPSPHTVAPCPCTPPPQRTDSKPSHASLAHQPAAQGPPAAPGQVPPQQCAWPRSPAPGWHRAAAAWSMRSPADPSPLHSRRLHGQELLDRRLASFKEEEKGSPHKHLGAHRSTQSIPIPAACRVLRLKRSCSSRLESHL